MQSWSHISWIMIGLYGLSLIPCYSAVLQCPRTKRYGRTPPATCRGPMDPNLKPKSKIEKWFTKKMWEGWGNQKCMPYSYEAFVIAARYFPEFGAGKPRNKGALNDYTIEELQRRDVAAFFAHVVQETGENNARLFKYLCLNYISLFCSTSKISLNTAKECFYRGGFYQYFEGGPKSPLFAKRHQGQSISDGETCVEAGRYCKRSLELDFWYPCKQISSTAGNSSRYSDCYFGRGPLQLSWNYNYGQFQNFLRNEGISVDLLNEPNQLIEMKEVPLAMISALWFYMTPQPPKPSMHDIIMGDWFPSKRNREAGYEGSIFGPTNLVINNECSGEETDEKVGGPGENRRIKAFKWFCSKFGVKPGPEETLSYMVDGFDSFPHSYSWQPDWAHLWKAEPCDCAPAPYPGALPYYDPKFYSERLIKDNERNRLRCVYGIYKSPETYKMDKSNSPCLNYKDNYSTDKAVTKT